MIEIEFQRDGRGRLSSVFARGHAEFGAFPHDVVCAAVSAILQAAYAGLTDVAKIELEGKREPGDLEMRIPAAVRDRRDVAAIVATAEVSLRQLARQYPKAVRVRRRTRS